MCWRMGTSSPAPSCMWLSTSWTRITTAWWILVRCQHPWGHACLAASAPAGLILSRESTWMTLFSWSPERSRETVPATQTSAVGSVLLQSWLADRRAPCKRLSCLAACRAHGLLRAHGVRSAPSAAADEFQAAMERVGLHLEAREVLKEEFPPDKVLTHPSAGLLSMPHALSAVPIDHQCCTQHAALTLQLQSDLGWHA